MRFGWKTITPTLAAGAAALAIAAAPPAMAEATTAHPANAPVVVAAGWHGGHGGWHGGHGGWHGGWGGGWGRPGWGGWRPWGWR